MMKIKEFLRNLKHMLWLWKQMIVLWCKGDFEGSYEAWLFTKIHWNYEGKRLNDVE